MTALLESINVLHKSAIMNFSIMLSMRLAREYVCIIALLIVSVAFTYQSA